MTHWSSAPPLRLGLVQTAPVKGDVSANLRTVARMAQAHAGSCDLLVFPETALTGYHLQGAVESLARSVGEVAEGLGAPPRDAPDLVVGFYERHGAHLHNAVAHFEPASGGYRPVHVHRKVFLPTYGIFDEARFVVPGRDVAAYDSRLGRLGLLVCEDALHSLTPTILALDGAELVLTVSAAPARDPSPGSGRPASLVRWDHAMAGAAAEHGIFAAVTHPVGSEGGILFPGSALLADPRGRVVARGPGCREAVVEALVAPGEVGRARARSSMLSDLRTALPSLRAQLERAAAGGRGNAEAAVENTAAGGTLRGTAHTREQRAGKGSTATTDPGPDPGDASVLEVDPELLEALLLRFLKDEFAGRGFERAVIGLSGGLDSAASLVLTARALGPENVHAFSMPDATSRPESGEHAALVAEAAGVDLRTLPVAPMVDAYVESAEPELTAPRRGNAASRTRALILFDQAAKHGALPVGTGNKSERLLGYFTWHGDDSPPINPLGDLFKTQVLQLARHLGVPGEIVSKPPSADLVAGVDDADELGVTYEEADPILHWLMMGYAPEELVERGFRKHAVERVSELLEGTHWKRSLPTTAIVSETSVGAFYLRPVDLRQPGSGS